MTTLKFKKLNAVVWEDFAYQLISRYIGVVLINERNYFRHRLCHFHVVLMTGRYGVKAVAKWKFEAWNEPDLKGYNVLNFTLKGLTSDVQKPNGV